VVVRVMSVRAGRTFRGYRMALRPSVPTLLLRYVGRWLWDWRREFAALFGFFWLADVFGPGAGRIGFLFVVGLVLVVPWTRRGLVGWFAGGRWRRRWAAACRACNLMVSWERTPRVRRVRRTAAGVVLAVQVRPGQSVADVERAVPALGAALGALGVAIAPDRAHAGRARVTVRLREPLRATVTPDPLPDGNAEPRHGGGLAEQWRGLTDRWRVWVAGAAARCRAWLRPAGRATGGADLRTVPVGLREDGGPWLLPLQGSHALIAGATGAGKGSVLWAIVRALAPAVRAGLVEIWACDPKGGMELAGGARLFARFAYTPDTIADLLDDAAAWMQRREDQLRGVARVHRPTPGDPLVVVLVDELGFVTAYGPADVRRRIAESLPLLLTQGRAPGFVVLAAVQDPRKDVTVWRDLIPTRVCLRTAEAGQVDMVLGRGSWAAGAHAELIGLDQAGTGYVRTDDEPTPVLVRAAWQDDDDIAQVAAVYGQRPAQDLARVDGGGLRPVAVRGPEESAAGPLVGWVPDVRAVPPPGALPSAAGPGAWPGSVNPPDQVDPVDPPTVPLRGWYPPPPPALPAGRQWPPVPPPPMPPRISESDRDLWEAWAADWRARNGIDDDGEPLDD